MPLPPEPPDLRVGLGWDIHRLEEAPGGSIVIAGTPLPCDLRLIAHSDGDVVLHALCDALLGAVGAGDIGEHFPDTDPRHAGQDSTELLARVRALPALADWQLVNIDVNIIAQRPRLGDHKPAMRQRLQELLGLPADRVGLKARSKERCDAVGEGRAIEAQVVVLISRGTGPDQA